MKDNSPSKPHNLIERWGCYWAIYITAIVLYSECCVMTLFLIDSHVGLAWVSREHGGRICMVEEREGRVWLS